MGARQYERAMDYKSPEQLRAMLDDPDETTPRWVKDKIEAGLAVQAIVAALHAGSVASDPQGDSRA